MSARMHRPVPKFATQVACAALALGLAALLPLPAAAQAPAPAPAPAPIPIEMTATLERAPSPSVVAGGLLWRCEETQCRSIEPHNKTADVACRALVMQVGTVRAFSVAGRPFDAQQIQRCNKGSIGGAINQAGPRQ